MTSSLLAPRHRPGARWRPRTDAEGSTAATAILDVGSAQIVALVSSVAVDEPRERVKALHRAIAASVRPVYAMEELQAASMTLRRGRGSCSQRLAVLEAAARRTGVPTRVRGIVADGSFWYPRFPHLTALVPERVILAWPEFRCGASWVQAGELYGSLDEMASCGLGFGNADGETLFDAIGRTAIDWDGRTGVASCDLSAVVREDLGYFDSRDDLFATHGQTLGWLARRVADPIMGRRTAS